MVTLRVLLRLNPRTGRVFDFASRLHSSINVSTQSLTYIFIPGKKKVLRVIEKKKLEGKTP